MAEELEFGIEQYKAGNKQEARRIFLKVIKEHPNYTRAYLWLYNVAYNDDERKKILTKVLQINPTQEDARRLYAQLIEKEKNSIFPPLPRSVINQAPPPPAQPKRNNNITIGLSVAIVLIICCFCGFILLMDTNNSTIPSFTGYRIEYVVSGSANSAFVTYFNETGGTEQIQTAVPWRKQMNVETGAALSIVAQNNGSGTITCEIWVNGVKRKTSTSTAEYAVVTCSDFAY